MTYFPTQSTLEIAGLTITTPPSGLIYLTTQMQANSYGTFRKTNATAGYTPSGGNKFVAIGGWLIAISSSSTASFALGYGNTDVGVNSASPPTTPVYIAGDSDAAAFLGFNAPSSNGGKLDGLTGYFEIPNGKYPFVIRRGGAINVAIWLVGYEAA